MISSWRGQARGCEGDSDPWEELLHDPSPPLSPVLMHPHLPSELCSHTQSCLILHDPMDCSPPGSSVHGVFQARNTEVGSHFLLQGIFLTQGLNPCLLHWQTLYNTAPLSAVIIMVNIPNARISSTVFWLGPLLG